MRPHQLTQACDRTNIRTDTYHLDRYHMSGAAPDLTGPYGQICPYDTCQSVSIWTDLSIWTRRYHICPYGHADIICPVPHQT